MHICLLSQDTVSEHQKERLGVCVVGETFRGVCDQPVVRHFGLFEAWPFCSRGKAEVETGVSTRLDNAACQRGGEDMYRLFPLSSVVAR
jgi:hypothetical protein